MSGNSVLSKTESVPCLTNCESNLNELCYAETRLKIFVIGIPRKKGLVGTSPAKPSFGMTWILEYYIQFCSWRHI